jgi:hypothetical protein
MLILILIKENIDYSENTKKSIYHDLDKFAGTWSTKDIKEFKKIHSYLKKSMKSFGSAAYFN